MMDPSRMSAWMALKLLPPPETKTAMAALGVSAPISGGHAVDDVDVEADAESGDDEARPGRGLVVVEGRRMHGNGGTHPGALRALGCVDVCPDWRVVATQSPLMA